MQKILFLVGFLTLKVWSQSPCDAKNVQNTLVEAQKHYLSQQWDSAAVKFTQILPCMPANQKLETKLWSIRSLAQDSASLSEALSQLDTLIVTIEPEQKEYLDLMLTATGVLLQADKAMEAWKSWRQAKQVSVGRDQTQLQTLCLHLSEKISDAKLKTECANLSAGILNTSGKAPALPPPPPVPAMSNNSPGTPSEAGNWVLQFGAFGVKDNAELLLANLKKQKIPCRIVTKNSADRVLWLVQTEGFATKEAALQYGTTKLLPLQLDFQAIPAQ